MCRGLPRRAASRACRRSDRTMPEARIIEVGEGFDGFGDEAGRHPSLRNAPADGTGDDRRPSSTHASAPTSGTKPTDPSRSSSNSLSERRVNLRSSGGSSSTPTGMTSRPPIFNWDFRAGGICEPPAETMMASNSPPPGQPFVPSACRRLIFGNRACRIGTGPGRPGSRGARRRRLRRRVVPRPRRHI